MVSTVVTKHARYRMKQRCGVGKKSAHRMAEKVYRLGVRHGRRPVTCGNGWMLNISIIGQRTSSDCMEIKRTYFTMRN